MDFSPLGKAQVLKMIAERPVDAPFAYVVTPNVDHIVRIQRLRSDLWPMYRSAWLNLCDSRILSLLASRTGRSLLPIPGSDLTADLLEEFICPDDRIAVVGGDPVMIATVRETYGLRNLMHHNPPMGFASDPAALENATQFVIEARARYTFLAVGSPQQEILAYQIACSGQATGIALCVGASLQFLSGDQRRAPRWLQQLALEWLFRLLSNPQRLWRRYLVDGPLILPIYNAWREKRDQRREPRHLCPYHARYRR
ncbi:WecB/TagA/CpsF family glycosyltransferase [Rhizorhapis suberifaciens]|uniref:Exopolysaccharide biosynthesis WecB/TagA/CpsF family protein n=1 Tax=Rhizorhapis suberifaciens TaxID=13656 RepID=A0A840HU14_9SPHN|nr:WecB/TagA/CpsF family glycosyltransferase [Rhizorhapis suberifaciens]MBB4640974.1 exopolysaccharide biosynthesis WecB/TagA/CpsF family protein [Rhizorhapis suberifaciens]